MHIGTMAVAFLMLGAQCGGPPPNPRSPEYPCGTRAHACSQEPLSCCWNSEVCGGQPGSGCPAGMCCYGGDSLAKTPGDAGASQQPQWK